MKNKDEVKALLDYFRNREGEFPECNEEAIVSAYQRNTGHQSLPIKILSVFGGILASLAFLGFLFIAGLYNSDMGLLVFGAVFIAGSIWISKIFDKIILDTISVSFFIMGFILLAFGCGQIGIGEKMVSVIFILIALCSICIVQNYMLSFVSVLIINGSILSLIIFNNAPNLVHLYILVLALAVVFVFMEEARIITANKTFCKLYDPVRAGLVFSFIAGLVFLCVKGVLSVSPDYVWLSSIVMISLIIYSIHRLFNVLELTEIRYKPIIYGITLLALSTTVLSPGISGSILIVLISFLVNYKMGMVLGIISFLCFISLYYYDLSFTLLIKSVLLFSTGIFFIMVYLITYKKLTADENV